MFLMSHPGLLMQRFRDFAKVRITSILTPVAQILRRYGVTANQVSCAGLVLSLCAAVLVAKGHAAAAGGLFLFACSFDLLDGALARLEQSDRRLGAFIDSTVDRISEGAVLAAISYRFALEGEALHAALVVVALLTCGLVSYARARAEGLGISCKVGLLTRAERVILITAGLLFGVMAYALYILIALSAITVWQRIAHTARMLNGSD